MFTFSPKEIEGRIHFDNRGNTTRITVTDPPMTLAASDLINEDRSCIVNNKGVAEFVVKREEIKSDSALSSEQKDQRYVALYNTVRKYFEQAKRLDNDNFIAHINLGVIRALRGTYAVAQEEFTYVSDTLQKLPANIFGRNTILSICKYEMGRTKQDQIGDLQQATQADLKEIFNLMKQSTAYDTTRSVLPYQRLVDCAKELYKKTNNCSFIREARRILDAGIHACYRKHLKQKAESLNFLRDSLEFCY